MLEGKNNDKIQHWAKHIASVVEAAAA